MSHPARVRELKCFSIWIRKIFPVAPYMGAGVKISELIENRIISYVAPLAGA